MSGLPLKRVSWAWEGFGREGRRGEAPSPSSGWLQADAGEERGLRIFPRVEADCG